MSVSDTLTAVDTALTEAEKIIPQLTPFISLIPGASAVVPFLSLLPVLVEAVETIMKATGTSQTGAITAVRSHLTPGMPNAVALGQSASAQGSA